MSAGIAFKLRVIRLEVLVHILIEISREMGR